MTPIRSIVAAAVLVLTGVSSQAANLGVLDLSSGSTGFLNTPIAGSFTDTFVFTLTNAAVVSGSVTSVVSGNQDVDFAAISITGPGGVFNFTQLLPDPVEVWAIAASPTLSAGSYTLTLTGFNSAGIGSYGGNLAVTAAVPEPETLALMLGGLGAVGFMARRRKS